MLIRCVRVYVVFARVISAQEISIWFIRIFSYDFDNFIIFKIIFIWKYIKKIKNFIFNIRNSKQFKNIKNFNLYI